MELTIDKVEELIEMLKEQGVSHFEGLGLVIDLRPDAAPLVDEGYSERAPKVFKGPAHKHPGLWPHGEPQFPKSL